MEAIHRPALSVSRVSSSAKTGLDRRRSTFHFAKIPSHAAQKKLSISICLAENSTRMTDFEANTALKHTTDQAKRLADETLKSSPIVAPTNEEVETSLPLNEEKDTGTKRHAKIHDFCLGIPFGGIVFGGGLFGFLFSRNPASLTTGGLLGGAILAMGFISLKVWRQGLSSLPFILGQGALAATFLWKHLQVYSLTKKAFPSIFYVVISAAMLCFYLYVLVSGGNPPPKQKSIAAAPS